MGISKPEPTAPRIPDEAVHLALAARADALSDRPDPMVLSNETLTRMMLEAALPAIAEAFDLTWLLDNGWLARLGQSRAPDNSPAGYYASVRRMGGIAEVSFTGATVAEVAAKAREWAEGRGTS
jgi:hypothetical protein